MRKELIVYVNTGEHTEEIGITTLKRNRSFVILSLPNGSKITASKDELVEALKILREFDDTNNNEPPAVLELDNSMEVTYGEVDG